MMPSEDQSFINIIEIKGNKNLTVKPLDASRLLIDTSGLSFLKIDKDQYGDIRSVAFEGMQSIGLGDRIFVKIGIVDSRYEVKMIIVETNQKNVILLSSLPTKTSTFLLPLLNKTKLELKYDTYFENAFLDAELEHLCLLYRFTGTELYQEFESSIMSEKLFVKRIGYDPYHTMYMFRIPEEFRDDISYFIEGKYSKFSDNLKENIFRFYGSSQNTVVYQVIHKERKLKQLIERNLDVELEENMELASKPIREQEFIESL